MTTQNLFDLTGRTAIITGGSRGLGKEMALAFAENGANVVVASRKKENCEEVAEAIRAMGKGALAVGYHAASWADAQKLADAAIGEFGKIDILVNNAGMAPLYSSLVDVTEDLYNKVLDVNLKGPFRLSALIGTHMTTPDASGHIHGGAIINVSSTSSQRPSPNEVVYGAAKAAINTLTIGLSRTYGPHVRVNCIVPGPFLTDISKAWDLDQFNQRAKTAYSLQRGGQPHEIVGAALYLASDASSYTTGMLLNVDGGPR
jgi:NAD(P)-dependent dehydrogenase (short-subunit alcohol dehydrogenase family)